MEFIHNLKGYIGILCLICFHTIYAQTETFAWKDWEKNSKLTVEDFKGTPDPNSTLQYSAPMEISPYVTSLSDDSSIFLVVVRFEKSGAWTKIKDHPESFLRIEQKLFDIEEIYARAIRKELLTQHFASYNDVDFDKLTSKYEDTLCYDEIREYYFETSLGADTIEVRNWDKKVQRELDSLSAYSNPIVRLKLPRR
jgi:hypothetical protein